MTLPGSRGAETDYLEWTARKRTGLRRKALDCGHPNPGEVFYHAWCDRLSCSEACANGVHECGEYAGVNSSSEEESEPVEAAGFLAAALAETLVTLAPAVERALDELVNAHDTSQVPFDTLRLTTDRGYVSRLWAEDWDSPEDATHDEPNGSAPTDPVADAMRSEVLRQGLTECEIDGVRQEYRDGDWIIDETHTFSRLYLNEMVRGRIEPDGPIHHGPGPFSALSSPSLDQTWARTAGPQAYWPEPVVPHVDESVEPDPHTEEAMTEPTNRTADPWVVEIFDGGDWIAHLHGVEWAEAPIPPRRHACTPQSRARFGGETVERCACAAIRHDEPGFPWMERNRRRGESAGPLRKTGKWWHRLFPGRSTR